MASQEESFDETAGDLEALLRQRAQALLLRAGLRKLRFVAAHGCARLLDRRLHGPRIDLEQKVALPHHVAFAEVRLRRVRRYGHLRGHPRPSCEPYGSPCERSASPCRLPGASLTTRVV